MNDGDSPTMSTILSGPQRWAASARILSASGVRPGTAVSQSTEDPPAPGVQARLGAAVRGCFTVCASKRRFRQSAYLEFRNEVVDRDARHCKTRDVHAGRLAGGDVGDEVANLQNRLIPQIERGEREREIDGHGVAVRDRTDGAAAA